MAFSGERMKSFTHKERKLTVGGRTRSKNYARCRLALDENVKKKSVIVEVFVLHTHKFNVVRWEITMIVFCMDSCQE